MIINRLREEGVVSKSELMVWLKDRYKQGFGGCFDRIDQKRTYQRNIC